MQFPAGDTFFAPLKKNLSRLQPLKLPRLSFKSNSSDICRFMFLTINPVFFCRELSLFSDALYCQRFY